MCKRGWITQLLCLRSCIDIHHFRKPWLNMFKNRKKIVYVSSLSDKNSKMNKFDWTIIDNLLQQFLQVEHYQRLILNIMFFNEEKTAIFKTEFLWWNFCFLTNKESRSLQITFIFFPWRSWAHENSTLTMNLRTTSWLEPLAFVMLTAKSR